VTIGYVDGRAVPRDELDRRLAAMRRGPRASALPSPGSPEDRQLTRWVAQVLLTQALCEAEAQARGLEPQPPVRLDQRAAVELGSIAAAAFEGSGAVRAVFAALTTSAEQPPAGPSTEVAEHRLSTHDGEFYAAADSLPAELARATIGETVVVQGVSFTVTGTRTVTVAEPMPDHSAVGRRLAFVRWLDHARAHRVRLMPGFEHPGDPAQPDNHHRH
jgi:[acyl-carrier-protein] S-malonyltransferase